MHKSGMYFEMHHILPKSVGGSDNATNKVLLTAKEHYICHHLLAKIYKPGSVGYSKMIYALWRMSTRKNIPEVCMSATEYEKLRIELARLNGKVISKRQSGKGNSLYGSKWYTNIDNGETMQFFSYPGDRWIPGRNWFNRTIARPNLWSISTKRPVTLKHGKICGNPEEKYQKREAATRHTTHVLWNRFHAGNYTSISQFCRETDVNLSVVALTKRFIKYIPVYSNISKQGKLFTSDQALVNVYD